MVLDGTETRALPKQTSSVLSGGGAAVDSASGRTTAYGEEGEGRTSSDRSEREGQQSTVNADGERKGVNDT